MKTKSKSFFMLLLFGLNFAALAHAGPPATAELDHALKRAADAGLAEAQMNRVLGAGYRFNLAEADVIVWLNQLTRALRENLPLEPFLAKMEEGLAKHIEPARIHNVLEQLHNNLKLAGRFIKDHEKNGQRPSGRGHAQLAVRISGLLAAGLSAEELQRLQVAFPQVELGALVEAATFKIVLRQSGLDSAVVEDIIHTGLANRRFHEFPLELAQAVKAARLRNDPAETISEICLAVMGGTLSMEQARQQMGFGQPARNGTGPENRTHGSGSGGSGSGSGSGGGNGGGGNGGGGNGSGGNGSGGGGGGGSGNGGGPR